MDRDWSALPLDILCIIAMKLDTLKDFVTVFKVCRLWNRVSPLIKQHRLITVPWLLLAENPKKNPKYLRKIYDISSQKCYQVNLPETFGTRCWGTPYGWIVVVDENLNVRLFNPITKAQITFPSLETYPNIPLFEDKERSRSKVLRDKIFLWKLAKKKKKFVRRRLKIFFPRLIVVKVSENDFVILNRFGTNLAYARSEDHSWSPILTEQTWCNNIVDVVGMDDNVFALYEDGSIDYWNVKEFYGLELIKPMDYSTPVPEITGRLGRRIISSIYLVKSGSDLIMVLRYKHEIKNEDHTDYNYDICYQTYAFDVFRFKPDEKNWVEIKDLGDSALFVGNNSSMHVFGASTKSLQCNSVYFTDDEFQFWKLPTKFSGHDMGIYDISTEEISQFYEGEDKRLFFCPPTLFIPRI